MELLFGEVLRFGPADEEDADADPALDAPESPGSAAAIPGLLATAAPTPSATASAPILPT
ncbi:hypothetical protein [Mycobacterium syngnathidarum]